MVAFTPNRSYPYPTSGDRVDIPEDIQALAEAVDLDMQGRYDSVIQRPFAKISSRSVTKQVFSPDTTTDFTFDFVDADNAGMTNISGSVTRLRPNSAGLWAVVAAVEIPNGTRDTADMFLRRNGSDIGRNVQHVNPPTGAQQMMTMSAMAFMNGTTDYFTATLNMLDASEVAKIGNKSMACFRVTNA
jgi:hypothetical protein